MIIGMGIDLVDIDRMKKLLAKWSDRFTGRCFSQREVEYCSGRAVPAIHFAARFAAKESFLKSLGIGLGMGVALKDIEVTRDDQGKPGLLLHGQAHRRLSALGVRKVHLSLTHTEICAAAVVILET
jgi:holo-[acyl-carrier protein] synthase